MAVCIRPSLCYSDCVHCTDPGLLMRWPSKKIPKGLLRDRKSAAQRLSGPPILYSSLASFITVL